MKYPWRKVVEVDATVPWWERFNKKTRFFLKLSCGHFVWQISEKPPKKKRCEGCSPK